MAVKSSLLTLFFGQGGGSGGAPSSSSSSSPQQQQVNNKSIVPPYNNHGHSSVSSTTGKIVSLTYTKQRASLLNQKTTATRHHHRSKQWQLQFLYKLCVFGFLFMASSLYIFHESSMTATMMMSMMDNRRKSAGSRTNQHQRRRKLYSSPSSSSSFFLRRGQQHQFELLEQEELVDADDHLYHPLELLEQEELEEADDHLYHSYDDHHHTTTTEQQQQQQILLHYHKPHKEYVRSVWTMDEFVINGLNLAEFGFETETETDETTTTIINDDESFTTNDEQKEMKKKMMMIARTMDRLFELNQDFDISRDIMRAPSGDDAISFSSTTTTTPSDPFLSSYITTPSTNDMLLFHRQLEHKSLSFYMDKIAQKLYHQTIGIPVPKNYYNYHNHKHNANTGGGARGGHYRDEWQQHQHLLQEKLQQQKQQSFSSNDDNNDYYNNLINHDRNAIYGLLPDNHHHHRGKNKNKIKPDYVIKASHKIRGSSILVAYRSDDDNNSGNNNNQKEQGDSNSSAATARSNNNNNAKMGTRSDWIQDEYDPHEVATIMAQQMNHYHNVGYDDPWSLLNVIPGVVVEERYTAFDDPNQPPMSIQVYVIWGKVWMGCWPKAEGPHHPGLIHRNGTVIMDDHVGVPVPSWIPWKTIVKIAEELGRHKDLFEVNVLVGSPSSTARKLQHSTRQEQLASIQVVVTSVQLDPTATTTGAGISTAKTTTKKDSSHSYHPGSNTGGSDNDGRTTNNNCPCFYEKEILDELGRLWLAGYAMGIYSTIPNAEVPIEYVENQKLTVENVQEPHILQQWGVDVDMQPLGQFIPKDDD